tara:strand:- start:5459 stop:6766 length:1308 start_codon:yes stop_codon:yes gene_type:complete
MGLVSWLGRKLGLSDGPFWSAYFGGETWSGKTVSADTAMQLSAFWGCVRLNSQRLGTLPITLFKREQDGSRVSAADHPLYSILHDQPNADQTAAEYWTGMIARLCLCGNAFSEKSFEGGRLVALQPPQDMQPYRTAEGELRFRFNDRGKLEDLPEERVFHLRGFGLGGDLGLSPVAYARQTLGIALATEESAGKTFANGMRASGIFTFPTDPTPAQRQQFQQNYIKPVEGSENEGKSLVLPPGFKWQQINIPPKDAEMLVSRRHNVEEICRWFSTPPILVGHSSEGMTAWGSGIEQINLFWLTYGLDPEIKRIEQAIRRSLISPADRSRGIYAEFIIDALLRADSAARAQHYSTALQNGWMTRREVRRKENMPPMPGDDILTVQSNLVPLDQLGSAGASQNAREAFRAWLMPEDQQADVIQISDVRRLPGEGNRR